MARRALGPVSYVLGCIAVIMLSFWIGLAGLDHFWPELGIRFDQLVPVDGTDAPVLFRAGEKVAYEGEQASLVTANGRRIEIIKGNGGAMEAARVDVAGRATMAGWAVDYESARPAIQVVVTLRDRVWVSGVPSNPREDIAAQNQGLRNSGFAITGQGLPKAGLQYLRAYALLRGGATARELTYVPQQ